MKKKRITFLALLILTFSLFLVPILSGCNNKVRVLKVYNAQDYIQDGKDESVLKDFEDYYYEKTGEKIRIQYDTFDTLERGYTIINNRKADYDVMCPSDYIIEKMKKNNLLNELNLDKIPNIQNIPPYLLDRKFDPDNKYSVPYMWGTVGIMYNTEKVSEEDLNGWGLLWNNKYKNKILMKDSIRDSVFIATIYTYREELETLAKTATAEQYRAKVDELVNNISAESMAKVEKELRDQYNILYAYEVDSGKDSMINGEAYINLAWSGDAVWAIEEAQAENKKNKVYLDYYIPEEGSNIWFDNWVIPKYAKNVDIAHEFINFMCDPEIALRNMDETGYTTAVLSADIIDYMIDEEAEANDFTYLFEGADGKTNDALRKSLEEAGIDLTSLQIHEISMPSADKAERLVEMTDFGEKQDIVVKMWTRVKALPLGIEVIIFSICLVIAIVGMIAYSIYKKVENKKLVAGKMEEIGENSNSTNNFSILSNCQSKIKDYYTKLHLKMKSKNKEKTESNNEAPDIQTDNNQMNSTDINAENCNLANEENIVVSENNNLDNPENKQENPQA